MRPPEAQAMYSLFPKINLASLVHRSAADQLRQMRLPERTDAVFPLAGIKLAQFCR
jgi:hypothetical protein